MYFSKRSGDRESELKRSTVAAWYAGVCFLICLGGGIWLASLLGAIDLGGEATNPAAYKAAAKEASQKAAAQQVQARQSAEEEARDIAADAHRLIKPPMPTPQVDPAINAASAVSDARPAAPATNNPAPPKPAPPNGP